MSDSYELGRSVGAGGFATVFLATRKKDGKKFVAKIFNTSQFKETDINAVENEAATLALSKHENIVTFEDRYRKGKMFHLIMEYCAGGTLNDRIVAKQSAGESFSYNEILGYLHPICLALEFIHSRSGIHRDLKPHNILLTETGIVKLGDFGLSVVAVMKSMVEAKSFAGTLLYMAPEVISASDNKKYNCCCDLWSLGVVLYELIMLERPFNSPNKHALFSNITKGKYKSLPVTVHRDFRTLTEELLSIDPSMRPSCKDILARPFLCTLKADDHRLASSSNTTHAHSRMKFNEAGMSEEVRRLNRSPIPLSQSLQGPAMEVDSTSNAADYRRSAHTAQTAAPSRSKEEIVRFWEGKLEKTKGEDPTKTSWTVLHLACKDGDIEAVNTFLRREDDVNAKTYAQWTPLYIACYYGHRAVASILLRNGANINTKDIQGETPLHRARDNGNEEIANFLIRNGAEVEAKDEMASY